MYESNSFAIVAIYKCIAVNKRMPMLSRAISLIYLPKNPLVIEL